MPAGSPVHSPVQLPALFHHRWTLPVLAALHRTQGTRFVVLVNTLAVGRLTLRSTLNALIRMGLVMRNPGYGHPLRPEYLLTALGMRLAPECVTLLSILEDRRITQPALRKWSLPVLAEVARGGERFSQLRAALEPITDRALTIALKDLQTAGLIARLVLDSYPPTTLYRATAGAASAVSVLRRLGAPAPPRPAKVARPARGGRAG